MSMGWQLAVKRAFDIVASSLLLLFLLPAFALIGLAIRLVDNCAPLYRQERYGRGMRPFQILKFRTMTCDEAGDRFVQATEDDPRITKLGRLLRRTSLDELPQLLNVLVGHMSLVGPRPHAVAMEREIFAAHPDAERRLLMRPGMTGLAQIRGHRGPTSSEADLRARLQADLDYIDGWTIGRDVAILLRTPAAWLTGKNAV
jgi:lipopolysaccharide/colanic/teichoic acid biosynthesis glycosyltransferase